MTDVERQRYSDEFYAAIDAQDFELALAIRERDKQPAQALVAPVADKPTQAGGSSVADDG